MHFIKKGLFIACLTIGTVYANPAVDLNKFLNQIQSFKANFTQNVYGKNDKIVQHAAGFVEFKKPTAFRWQIVDPDPALILTDGKTLWNYDEQLEQVSIDKFDAKTNVSPLSFLFDDPTKNFNIEQLSATSFKLTPKKSNQNFEHLELFFVRGKLSQLHLYDYLDQVSVFEFTQVQNNLELANDRFIFVPPAGVDVIGGQN